MAHRLFIIMGIGLMLLMQFGCIGYRTFPHRAQAGDTITLGGGLEMGLGNEFMDRSNTTVTLTKPDDSAFSRDLTANLQALFHLYPDPRSDVWNTNMFLGPLSDGRPFETGIALDLPADLTPGVYQLNVSSTEILNVWRPLLEIIDDPLVPGEPNCFEDQSAACSSMNDVKQLERLPFVRVSFGPQAVVVGAMEVTLTFDPLIVAANDINVISPRINYGSAGFGTTNRDHLRMFYWTPVVNEIRVSYMCPNGVATDHMFFDVVYPRGVANPLNMTTAVVTAWDENGNDISSSLTYSMDAH